MPSKDENLQLLRESIDDREQLPRSGSRKGQHLAAWDAWIEGVVIKLRLIFGDDSPEVMQIIPLLELVKNQEWAQYRFETSEGVIASLRNHELRIKFGQRGGVQLKPISEKRVFIAHGRDEARMNTIATFLYDRKLIPVILEKTAGYGKTILEKLEQHSNVGIVIVLLTPDDVGASVLEKDTLNPRARQNVIFELGYFLGKNIRTVALNFGVELPSNYVGILYIDYNSRTHPWQLELIEALKEAGFNI